jgi:hypothetical protein
LKEIESSAAAKVQQRELEMKRLAGEVAAAVARAQKEIENLVSDDKIRLALIETGLPAVASAFAQKFGEVKFTSFGGEASDPSAMIGRGIAQVMTLVKQVGAEVLAARPASRRPPETGLSPGARRRPPRPARPRTRAARPPRCAGSPR